MKSQLVGFAIGLTIASVFAQPAVQSGGVVTASRDNQTESRIAQLERKVSGMQKAITRLFAITKANNCHCSGSNALPSTAEEISLFGF